MHFPLAQISETREERLTVQLEKIMNTKALSGFFALTTACLGAGLIYGFMKISDLNARLVDQEAELVTLRGVKAEFDKNNASELTPEQKKEYGPVCSEWIGRKFQSEVMANIGLKHGASVSDAWMKHGSLVFEIFLPKVADAPNYGGESYLCVVDVANGTLSKPRATETTYWMR